MADYTYKAKVGQRWLRGNSLVDTEKDADTFESKTEPTQRLNQMKKDGKISKSANIEIVKMEESWEMTSEENADSVARETGVPYNFKPLWARNSRSLYDYDPVEEEKELKAKMKAELKKDRQERWKKFKSIFTAPIDDSLGCGYPFSESKEDFDSKYHRSYQFAKDRHDATGAIRKFSGAPYIVHPDGVAKIVDAYGGDDDQVKAALAHDLMEDAEVTYEEVEEYFGPKAARIVKLITNDPEEVKRVGKEKYISDELLSLPHEALLVKLGDMYYNMTDHCPEKQATRIVNNMIALSKRKDLTEPEQDLIDDILTFAGQVA